MNSRVWSGSASTFWIESYSTPASPPGKSARAEPPSGMNSVSPTKAASPTRKVMQAGVWPGVWIATACIVPIWKVSPSRNSRSNCDPSRWNSVPSLNTLPKVSCTTVIFSPMPILPPRFSCR